MEGRASIFRWVVIIVLGGFGLWMCEEGLERGTRFGRVDTARTYVLVVEDALGRSAWFRNDARATGRIRETGERAEVSIFESQARTLKRGDHLDVYRLGEAGRRHVLRRKLEESRPVLELGGIAFSWHLVLGVICLGGALLALLRPDILAADLRRAATVPRGRAETAVILGIAGVLTAAGGFLIAESLQRGERYGRVDASRSYTLVAEGKTERTGMFDESTAVGTIRETGERAEVAIFRTQYDTLPPGGTLEVYRLAPQQPGYVFRGKFEESLPIWRIGPLAFSWHALWGLFTAGAGIGLALHAWREGGRRGARIA